MRLGQHADIQLILPARRDVVLALKRVETVVPGNVLEVIHPHGTHRIAYGLVMSDMFFFFRIRVCGGT